MEGAARHAEKVLRARRREARAALGLSTSHIRPHYWAEVSPAGQYLAVKSTGVRQCITPKNKRGTVRTFSRRSRSRILKTFAMIDSTALSRSLFVTLTYPKVFPREPSIYQAHLQAFSKRLRRQFPQSSAVWKLEFQKRGAPHYHLLVLGVPFLARQWLSKAWYEVVSSHDERHYRAGTQVARVYSARKAISYAAKYIAKISESVPDWHTGRFWGAIGRRYLPSHRLQWPLERRGFARLSRVIRHLVSSRSRQATGARYPPGWCFASGGRGVVLIEWAAGLPWEPCKTALIRNGPDAKGGGPERHALPARERLGAPAPQPPGKNKSQHERACPPQ